jgi:predicted metal-binding membrane protein
LAGAAALAAGGAYQFSSVKDACLDKCRNPFALLFARWSQRTAKIFRLGFDHGVWCLGCCAGLMAAIVAVGLMNIFWMAVMAVFSLLEKQLPGKLAGRISGAILLVWSAMLLLISF